jgi:tetratricopeptide (TPR) repeat protein
MFRFKARFLAGFIFLCSLLSGCSLIAPQTSVLRAQRPADLPRQIELTQVPFFPQEDYFCGPAALAMALNAAGIKVSPDDLVEQVYLPGRKGSLQVEMVAAARRRGLVAIELAPQLTDMLREIAGGTPVIVLENYGPFSWAPVWHYSVVVGYDLDQLIVIRRSGVQQRRPTPLPIFEKIWKEEKYWAMIAVPPDRMPATATETQYANAVVALERIGQMQSALTAYTTMLKRWPTSLSAMMGRGNAAYALKDIATAEASFRDAVKAYPDSAASLNNLASVLAERGNLDEALTTAERAVALGGPLLQQTSETLAEIREKSDAAARELAARQAAEQAAAEAARAAAAKTEARAKASPPAISKPPARSRKPAAI